MGIERKDRTALERERRRLTVALFEKGLITREALEREFEAPRGLERPREEAV